MTDELLAVAEAVVVKPGDTLIVRVARDISQQEARNFKERLMIRLPQLADVVVIGADQLAIFHPNEIKEAE